MPLTQAEKSRRYREKLKIMKPEKFLEMKKKSSIRSKQAYQEKKKSLTDAQKEEHRLKLLQKKNKAPETVQSFEATSKEQSEISNSQSEDNIEDCSSEKIEETQSMLAAHERPIITESTETKSSSDMFVNRAMLRNMERNIEKRMRREINAVRQHLQKLMRGYNTLKKAMLRLRSQYKNVMKDQPEIVYGEEQEYTPFKRSDEFVQEHLINVATPVKENVKKKILELNVLTDSIKSKYKASQNKAKNTLKDIVDNPIIKKYKLKTHFAKTLGLKSSLKRHRQMKTKTFNLIEKITRFYERDDVSRASAGKKECRTFKKCKMQVRYLVDKLEALHKKYVSEVGPVSYSTFKKYRPFYVISPHLKDLETCACLKHSNMQFIVNALKSAGIFQSNNVNSILANLVCDPDFKQCMYGECSACKDNNVQVNREENIEVKWFSWNVGVHEYEEKGEKKKTKRMTKTETKGTLKDLVELFNKEITKFKIHVFNMRHQYRQYKLCIESLDQNECAIHVDFSENWLCKHHEEVQAMHFGASKKQITLHTGVLYVKDQKPTSFCTISPDNSHNPEAIWAHLDPILKHVRQTYPIISTVHFFSDGPATQYRQKKNFFLMSRNTFEYGFENFTWSYFESSHGKGAADGVGGTIKRTLDFKVSHGTDITDAQTAFKVLQESETSIKIFYINSSIELLENKLTPIKNTLKIHQIVGNAKLILKYRILSCFCENLKGKCECFGPEIHHFDEDDEEVGTRLELDETTGQLKIVREEKNSSIEIKENEISESELASWAQTNYLSEIDDTNIDIDIFNDSGILNAMECEANEPAEIQKYFTNKNKEKTYDPDSLNILCLKHINFHLSSSAQTTTAKLAGVCEMTKISKSDYQNHPYIVMDDSDLPAYLQPEISPSKLSVQESNVLINGDSHAKSVCELTKISKGDYQNQPFIVMDDSDLPACLQPEKSPSKLSVKESKVPNVHSELKILSNVKVTSRESSVKKHDIKKILKGAEVITQSALKLKIIPKKMGIKAEQKRSLNETDIFDKASTSKEPNTDRKRKNATPEIPSTCAKKVKKNSVKAKSRTVKDMGSKLENITTERKEGSFEKKRKSKTKRQASSKQALKKKNIRTFIESSTENSDVLSLADSDTSEYATFNEFSKTCLDDQEEKEILEPVIPFGCSDIEYFTPDNHFLKTDDWIVAKFATKKSLKHFVGRVLSIKNNIPTVKFLRKVKNSKGSKGLIFTYPNVEDVCEMHLNDVIKVLPQPNISRRGQINFATDLSNYNIQ